jgi:glycosyltransferase involved in cell wall biosynthesis
MHFGFVEKGYPGGSGGGGAGTFVQIMGRHLVSQGHRVTVVARTQDKGYSEEDDSGVRVCRVPVTRSRLLSLFRLPVLKGFRHIAGYLHQGRILAQFLDRCHAETPFNLVEYSEGGDFWHRHRREFKLVSHLHGSRYTFLKQSGRPVERADWRQRRKELEFIRHADWVLSPSRSLAGIVEEESARPLEKLTVRPYPLDQICAAAVPHHESCGGGLRAIFAARNDPVKGGDVLLKAVGEIERSGGGIEFDFFGYQPSPGQLMPKSVTIHGFVPRDRLLEHYSSADLAVIPSFWDNSPNTVYEAMAFGLPLIGAAVGGIPELIVDGETGFLVSPGDSESIARYLKKMRDDPALRMRMGVAGRERILSLASPESNLKARTEVYLDILAGRHSSPQPAVA